MLFMLQGELKPGEEKTFSVALLTRQDNITENELVLSGKVLGKRNAGKKL